MNRGVLFFVSAQGGHTMPLFGDPDVGKLEKKCKVGKLIKLLQHPTDDVASTAASALGRLGDCKSSR
jgi:hypothetical protein